MSHDQNVKLERPRERPPRTDSASAAGVDSQSPPQHWFVSTHYY